MCGIAALFAPRPQVLSDFVVAMTALARHRGPDDEGYAVFAGPELGATASGGADTPDDSYGTGLVYAPARHAGGGREATVALGHRRLSIVDLSPAGHQPMATADGQCWIVYNGEVYNHVELRAELEAKGRRFVSNSDTEVMLQAYQAWGEACLERFNGMFAFVLFDRARRRVLIARDRFGVKPLYLWRSPAGMVAVASEIKQFSTLPGWAPRLNGRRAYEFLNWGLQDHTGETMFDGVRQLRGGECVHCDVPELFRHFAVRRWYDLKPREFRGGMQEAAQGFQELFADAVRLRLRADVPVGSCLSGGLDSSSIVCVAGQQLRQAGAQARQHTFSACATVKRYDEREYIDEVVAHAGVHAHYTYPGLAGVQESFDAIAWHQDEPFGSSSIYAQWEVFKLAAGARVKVLLDGQGADELLAGYTGFFAPHFAGLFAAWRWGALWREMRAADRLHGMGVLTCLQYLGNALLPEPVRQPLRRLAGKSSRRPQWIDGGRFAFDDRDPSVAYGFKTASVNRMSASMLLETSVPMLLHWEDRDSMAHSVESRLPFLDYRLAEFVLGLPAELKLAGATTKKVLRHALEGVLPERVRTRMDKLGFVTPEEVWMRQDAPDLFRAEMRRAIEASQGILNGHALALLEDVIAGRRPFDFLPWRMMSFGRWMARFGVGF